MKECVQTNFADLFEHIPVLNTNEVYSLPQYPISHINGTHALIIANTTKKSQTSIL